MRDRVLIVDDDLGVRSQIRWALREVFDVAEAGDAAECLARFHEFTPSVVTMDLHLTGPGCRAGLDLLQRLLAHDPFVKVIMVTADTTDVTATCAVERGAWDYYTKPIVGDELRVIATRAAHVRRLQRAAPRQGRAALVDSLEFSDWLGVSVAAKRVARLLDALAPGPEPVLLVGEAGTGRDLAARALHAASGRAGRFARWVCAEGLPQTDDIPVGGTLFLEGIQDLDVRSQACLPEWIGEIEESCRVVVSAFGDLQRRAGRGQFSEAAYHFLAALTVSLPPLRERPEDIPHLAERLVSILSVRVGKQPKPLSDDARTQLVRWPWPGNFRELEKRVLAAVLLSPGAEIEADDLWPRVERAPGPLKQNLAELERSLVGEALEGTRGNVTRAARALHVSRPTLHALMRKHGIDPHAHRPGQPE